MQAARGLASALRWLGVAARAAQPWRGDGQGEWACGWPDHGAAAARGWRRGAPAMAWLFGHGTIAASGRRGQVGVAAGHGMEHRVLGFECVDPIVVDGCTNLKHWKLSWKKHP